MHLKYLPMRIVFSPEFLTEKNAIEDFKNCNRIIVAGDEEDASVVLSFFLAVVYDRATGELERKVIEKFSKILAKIDLSEVDRQVFMRKYAAELAIAQMKSVVLYHESDTTVAEMTKLYANGLLATKVMYSNEIYQMCDKLGISYDDVRFAAMLDTRVGDSHTAVPGHDGHNGFRRKLFL